MTVSAADVTTAVAAAVAALAEGADADWSAPAGDVTWSCWETTEHIADDLFTYAAQLSAGAVGYLPFDTAARRPGGPDETIRADPASGTAGLFTVLTAMGALLAAAVRAAGPDDRADHPFGAADAEAAAAMGVLETVVHTRDVAQGLGVVWEPERDVCARVLARLFPSVERTGDAWADLLWATGRIALPGRPRRVDWSWENTS